MDKMKKGQEPNALNNSKSVGKNKEPTNLENGKIEISETMGDVEIILDNIFNHQFFKEYLSKSGNEKRIGKYKIDLLEIIKKDLEDRGGDIRDIMVMEAVKDYAKKAGTVSSILEKIVESGYDELLELRRIKKEDQESDELEEVEGIKNKKAEDLGERNEKDFEKMEKAIGTNKEDLTENIERYKKSLITILGKLKNKFNEFLKNDLEDNPDNEKNRRKFFQVMSRYKEDADKLLKSKENSKEFHDKLRDFHIRIEQDLLLEWSADKLKSGKNVEKGGEKKETNNQRKRRKFFERKYGKDVDYTKHKNGFPISSFRLVEIIIGETKLDDEVKVILDDGEDNGKEKIITIKEFHEILNDGYEKIDTSIDTSTTKKVKKRKKNKEYSAVDNPEDLPLKELKDVSQEDMHNAKFSEKEKKIIEGAENIAFKFAEKQKGEFNWENFPKGRISQVLEIQTIKFLMDNFKKYTLFADREEEVAELIVSKIKDKF